MTITRVAVGDNLRQHMKADTWNAFIDAANLAKLHPDRFTNPVFRTAENPSLTCMVRNDSGAAIERGHILGINEPIITPTQNEDEFRTRVGLVGVVPQANDFGRFLVAAESIPEDEIGLAYCSGVVACDVSITHDWLTHADVDPGDATKLDASPHGTAQILWIESGTGVKRAVVRMGPLRDATVIGKPLANVSVNATNAEIEVWRNGAGTGYSITNVKFNWMTGSQIITGGKQVAVTWFSNELAWRITGAECE